MDDNLSLDEEIKARYRSMYVGVFFKRYIMGLWAAAEGIIYDMFDENKHVQDMRWRIRRKYFLRERILIQEKARNILADMEQSH